LYINILVYKLKHGKSQNEFQWIIKHVFWQDYFLHMQHAPKARHLQPMFNIFLGQMLKKNESLALQPFPSKFQDFEIST